MSELKVDALTGKTSAGDITVTSEGGAATQSLQQGLAKAWVNFNGTGTVAVSDSLNSSSVSDRGTGAYTFNINNALSNATYARSASGVKNDINEDGNFVSITGTTGLLPTTSSCPIKTCHISLSGTDFPQITLTFHGDLA